ncbi:MAG: TauD/TfdA family dioxygenase [Pseudomonadota bacterium]
MKEHTELVPKPHRYAHPSDWQALVELPTIAATPHEVMALTASGQATADRTGLDTLTARLTDELFERSGVVLLDLREARLGDDAAHQQLAQNAFQLLGPLVNQKLGGTSMYAVRDQNKPFGHGVRRSITRFEQEFHTDGGWLRHSPEIVGLYCVRQAPQGGENSLVSLVKGHNRMLDDSPGLLAELYKPMWWDRQGEHGESASKVARQPVFGWRGHDLECRFYVDYVRKGQALAGRALSSDAHAALTRFTELLQRDETVLHYKLASRQLLFIHNRRVAHARAAFAFEQQIDERRLLFRMWTRRDGDISMEGDSREHIDVN